MTYFGASLSQTAWSIPLVLVLANHDVSNMIPAKKRKHKIEINTTTWSAVILTLTVRS
jgi:hypothetical protein